MSNATHSIECNDDINIIGTCLTMCPLEEYILRKKEKMIHILEVTQSKFVLVKSYSRSAADKNMTVSSLLRPFDVLMETVHYLLLEVSKREDVKMSIMYNFIHNRLMAVLQDMTIQRMPTQQCDKCTLLLEPMIRFYVYFGYRMCDSPPSEFDPVLNKKYILQCLKLFLSCSDTLAMSPDIDKFIDFFKCVDIKNGNELFHDRTLMESLYILCNLDDVHPLYRYLSLPKKLKTPALVTAYDIAVANIHGNYIRMWRLAKSLCPLTFAALYLNLPVIQRRAFKMLSVAYNNKQLTVPVAVVRDWLAFNSDEELRTICAHYGLKATDGVLFNKGDFKIDVDLPRSVKNYQAKILHMKLHDVLTYNI